MISYRFYLLPGHSTNNRLDRQQVTFNVIFIHAQRFISSVVRLKLKPSESLKRIYE